MEKMFNKSWDMEVTGGRLTNPVETVVLVPLEDSESVHGIAFPWRMDGFGALTAIANANKQYGTVRPRPKPAPVSMFRINLIHIF
jgi:hypothetical protein